MDKRVTSIYFSPGGTTKEIADSITSHLSKEPTEAIDLLTTPKVEERVFTADDVVVVAMPVFAGRIPAICAQQLKNLKGQGTPAIVAVVFGNRAYEDALLELTELLRENGFLPIGGCAMVARHSIFPAVAKGRPDEQDTQRLQAFTETCKGLVEKGEWKETLNVPGNHPYREAGGLPLRPSGDKKCIDCGICVGVCPVQAIPADNPRITEKDKCIVCTACIYHCPQNARGFHGLPYIAAEMAFKKKCAEPQAAEFFYIGE